MSKLMTPEQRQMILKTLKKGPQFGDREALGAFAVEVTEKVTGKNVKQHFDQHMKSWRKREANGPIPSHHTFLY